MRFFGFGPRRNAPQRVTPVNPLVREDMGVATGDAGTDGYSTLSRADPHWAGQPPDVDGTDGRMPQGPDRSFES